LSGGDGGRTLSDGHPARAKRGATRHGDLGMKKTLDDASGPMKCPVHVDDVDLFGEGSQEHWYEAYPILHAESPVTRLEGEGLTPGTDGYVLTRYADIARVVRDPERFRPTITLAVEAMVPQVERAHAEGRAPSFPVVFGPMLASMASLRPTHELYRHHKLELTDPYVGPGASRYEGMIGRAADELIDAFIERGEVEFVSEFARPLPQRVAAHVLGFPSADIPRLAEWGTAMVMSFVHGRGHRNQLSAEQSEAQRSALEGWESYVREHIAARRARPGDDMISFLTRVTYRALDRKLHDTEIEGIVYAMMLGGLETTQYALEQQAQLLCDDPALFRRVRADRGAVRAFTEEAMRLRAPTQGLSTRITTRDEVFQGVDVPAGSLLHLRFAAGNVDPEQYERPYELDLDRKRVAGHLAFSQGPRTCPGAPISRLEQQVAWSRILDRIGSLEYAPGNTFAHQPGIMLGTLELHLRFTRVA
jgi:cytochrome P450